MSRTNCIGFTGPARYLTGGSQNLETIPIVSNVTFTQGLTCGCIRTYLGPGNSSQQGQDDSGGTDQSTQCLLVDTVCELTRGNQTDPVGKLITLGYLSVQNSSNSEEAIARYTVDKLILTLGSEQAQSTNATNKTIAISYTMEVHSTLLKPSCGDDNSERHDNNDDNHCQRHMQRQSDGLLSWTTVDSQQYTALYTRDANPDQSEYRDLVQEAGDLGHDLVKLNTSCVTNSTQY